MLVETDSEDASMAHITDQIAAVLPHLRRYAASLTRNPDQAEDLVQDCVERALLKCELFQQGTDLRAWMFALMRNVFISGKRRQALAHRYAESLQHDGVSHQQPAQFHSAVLDRVRVAMETLSDEERTVVIMLGVRQLSYEEAAAHMGEPIGTMKSRLSRSRVKLRNAVLAERDQ